MIISMMVLQHIGFLTIIYLYLPKKRRTHPTQGTKKTENIKIHKQSSGKKHNTGLCVQSKKLQDIS